MATICVATQGFPLDCKAVGGVQTIYLVESTAVSSSRLSIVSGSVSNTGSFLSTGKQFFQYSQRKQQADWTEDFKSNDANQSIEFEEKITLSLFKGDVNKRNELQILTTTDVVAIVTKNDNTSWLVGATIIPGSTVPLGLSLAATYNTGKNFSDMNGYKLTLSGQSSEPAYQVSSSLIAALITPAS